MLTERKKVLVAGAASVLLHVLAVVAVAAIVASRPQPASPEKKPEPFHVELTASEPTPVPTPEHQVVDNSGMTEVEHPPTPAKLEGVKDTAAASEEPPGGEKSLPTQKGRVSPTYAFDPRPPEPSAPPAAASATPAPETAPPRPAPSRRSTLRATGDDPGPAQTSDHYALIDADPSTPPTAEVNPYDPSFRSTAPPLPQPVKKPAQAAAYHPLEERTASSGNITRRGASSVEASSTAFGRYQKSMLDSIGTVWNQELHARSDLASLGTIKVHFVVDRTGHVLTPRILSNSANEALASITLDSLQSAAIPPIPPEVVRSMDGATLQMDVTFESL